MKPRTLNILFALGRPLSPVYSLVMSLRRKAYQHGTFKTKKAARPVISVGNLSMGGTGKTPHVIAIARRLAEMGLKPAVVSRGYGGKAGRGPLIVSDGKKRLTDSATGGDEPCMMAEQLPGVPVVAGSNRVKCARAAVSAFDSQVIILDDGFQHLKLYRDLDIVLLPAAAPLGTGRVFPGGDLREPPEAIKRASALILSKCEQVPFNSLELIRNEVRSIAGDIPVFFSRTLFQGIRLAESASVLTAAFPSPVYCFCGIAGPLSFVSLVERQGMKVEGRSFFPDHHQIQEKELSLVFENARRRNSSLVLTTAKDFVRIKGLWQRNFRGRKGFPPLGIVEITAEPDPPFWQFLRTQINADFVRR